jgi:phosphoribosyl 1,2-cyclic phosphodiesterase
MSMTIRFWGVRGSIAAPGPETAAVGGNTSSVEICCGPTRILLDAGTGLRQLGDELCRRRELRAHLLLSHHHWDHIQGLPFFVPLYLPATELIVIGPAVERHSMHDVLSHQMTAPVFPVRLEEVQSRLQTREIKSGEQFAIDDAEVRAVKLNHPGGVLAYRIEWGGRSVVYATDTEHYSCVDPALRTLAQGADVLIYDAQYTPAEYRGESGPSRVGWGHSTYEDGARVAHEAGIGQLILFHHDPRRDDQAVAEIEQLARACFPSAIAAREGMSIELESAARAA